MSVYRFHDHQLDPQARTLSCEGCPVAIEPRVFDVVVYLIEQRHRAVGRDELIAAAWGRADCSDATLAQAILKARRLFGDSGDAQRTIRTAPRFGYQWVAATRVEARGADVDAPAEPSTTPAPPAPMPLQRVVDAPPSTRRRRRIWPWIGAATAACLALAAIGFAWRSARTPSIAAEVRPSRGLVLVAPANVHSALAQDGWMRLGIMAMSADALRTLPGRSLVPNETVLVAAGGKRDASPSKLREITGATTIVSTDARHSEKGWVLDATVFGADGSEQVVSAEDADAVAAAAALAERLRAALGGGGPAESEVSADTLAVTARMQAAILEGHSDRALAIGDSADPTSAVPEIALLRAGAMNRLGQSDAAVAAMRGLIERGSRQGAGQKAPAWLAAAWKTLGYGEMLLGHGQAAQQAFQQAIAAAGSDRGEAARGWRGLGNAQALGGAFAEAEASCLRARLELGEDGDPLLRAHIEDDLGSIAGHRGRYEEAIAHYRQAAEIAASIGATELELGSRMNIALSQTEQLHHVEALASWRALLPRLNALDYPSMQRYAAVHYAQALAETGALAEAQRELDRTEAVAQHASRDALDASEIDALRVQWTLGGNARMRDEARRFAAESGNAARRAAASALLVLSDLAGGDLAAAQGDAVALSSPPSGEDRSTHALSLAALAALQSRVGADALAESSYVDALALVRESGSPRDLREIVLPYAAFQLAHDRSDDARTTAGLVQPYADEDFAITLLLARLAADRSPAEARRLFERARGLAGARALPAAIGVRPALAVALPDG